MGDIDTGDSVKHAPTGETWVVAFVEGDRLYWCGWPGGSAQLSDCTLVKKASHEYRMSLLTEMADMHDTKDARCRFAQRALAGAR